MEILKGGFFTIHSVRVNPSLSVVTVFFEVFFPDMVANPDFEKEKKRLEEIRRKLVHSTPYLRGKLTQRAGLKYAPELKFVPYKVAGSSKQMLVKDI